MNVEYNNPAGRILAVLNSLAGKNKRGELASALGVRDDWQAVLEAIRDLLEEFELLKAQIETLRENPAKHRLYTDQLPDIQKSLNSLGVNLTGSFGANIVPTALVSLRFIAADLPQEEAADESELEALVRQTGKAIEAEHLSIIDDEH